jgi:hypothetical protein
MSPAERNPNSLTRMIRYVYKLSSKMIIRDVGEFIEETKVNDSS